VEASTHRAHGKLKHIRLQCAPHGIVTDRLRLRAAATRSSVVRLPLCLSWEQHQVPVGGYVVAVRSVPKLAGGVLDTCHKAHNCCRPVVVLVLLMIMITWHTVPLSLNVSQTRYYTRIKPHGRWKLAH
jgi:hypothetical protein